MSRATTSVGPAAANGTMILTGRSGYPGLCASAAAARSPAQGASTRAIALVTLMDTPLALSGPVPGIHVFPARDGKTIDGRDKPAPTGWYRRASRRQTDE